MCLENDEETESQDMQTIIRLILLYGTDVWTLELKQSRLLETTDVGILRRIKNVSRVTRSNGTRPMTLGHI